VSAPLSVADARAVAAACAAGAKREEAAEQKCRAELEQRTSMRDLAKTAVRIAENAFDREESEETALALAKARQDLEGQELLVAKARDRHERAEGSHRVALEAKDRADRALRVAELRALLDAPPAALEGVDVARRRIEGARLEAERLVKCAHDRFAQELEPLFARLDEDGGLRAALEELGMHVGATDPLYLALPWLRAQLEAGSLSLDTKPTWTSVGGERVGGPGAGSITPVHTLGEGPLSAAYRSLGSLRDALARRDAGAVLEAFGRLAVPNRDCAPVAAELLELLAQHRDGASLVAAIGEREQPERERVQREAEERAEMSRRPQVARPDRKFLEAQARLGNDYAKRQLGIDGQAIVHGAPLPRAVIPSLLRAGAAALGLRPDPGGFAASLPREETRGQGVPPSPEERALLPHG
jgi:hypothetical protein